MEIPNIASLVLLLVIQYIYCYVNHIKPTYINRLV